MTLMTRTLPALLVLLTTSCATLSDVPRRSHDTQRDHRAEPRQAHDHVVGQPVGHVLDAARAIDLDADHEGVG